VGGEAGRAGGEGLCSGYLGARYECHANILLAPEGRSTFADCEPGTLGMNAKQTCGWRARGDRHLFDCEPVTLGAGGDQRELLLLQELLAALEHMHGHRLDEAIRRMYGCFKVRREASRGGGREEAWGGGQANLCAVIVGG
jgi:hypothetical protein